MSRDLGLLKYIVPDLEKGVGVDQNQAHSFDVWTFTQVSFTCSKEKHAPTHSTGSTFSRHRQTRHSSFLRGEKDYTFYGHEVVGARMTAKILKDLKFSNELADKITKLVRWHMFFSDTEQISLSAVRRMIANVGKENVWDLMEVRACDRIGTGRPKESPYRLRKYHSMIEEVMRDPISVGMLKIDGKKLWMSQRHPGPRVGWILHALLEEVLDDPTKILKKPLRL